MPAGQGSGGIHDIRPAGDILRDIVGEAERIISEKFAAPPSAKPAASHV
jgi:hypothetical protein